MCIRDSDDLETLGELLRLQLGRRLGDLLPDLVTDLLEIHACLLYTSDAADDLLCVDIGGRRIIKKKNKHTSSQVYTSYTY